ERECNKVSIFIWFLGQPLPSLSAVDSSIKRIESHGPSMGFVNELRPPELERNSGLFFDLRFCCIDCRMCSFIQDGGHWSEHDYFSLSQRVCRRRAVSSQGTSR